jgi:hypothetical protein
MFHPGKDMQNRLVQRAIIFTSGLEVNLYLHTVVAVQHQGHNICVL